MKKACLGFLLIYILGLSACGFRIEDLPPLPTLAVEAEVSEASDGTVTPGGADPGAVTPDVKPTGTLPAEPTAVPVTPPERPTVTPKPTVTAKPTVTPKPTVTSAPTVTPTLTVTAKPTVTSVSTVTPRPTVTPKPTVTLKPTATPKPISAEIERLLELGEVYPNTVIRGEVCTSKAETDEYLREKTLKYSSFAVIAERPEYLQSAKEYMEQYPEIENMTIEKIDRYDNGYCAVFKNVETVYDANLCYAIRTGDRSVLTDVEKEIYQYLNAVRKGLEADSLDTVEKVRVFHDYLVLELKYDTTIQEISHSPEGVMRNRRAVCDGYARTLRLLLLMTGVESKIVCGAVRSESHAWNLVRMEDGWYHVDVTWDDPVPDVEGKVGYHYFLKNDAEMSRTHTWESGISCTENRYQLYMYRDVLCDSRDTMQKVYESQVTEKEYMLFCYPKGGELNEDLILDFLMEELNCGLTYYPEKELEDYMVFEVVNPLWE